MKILITGSEGFVGNYVRELFPDAIGYDVKTDKKDNILNKERFYSVLKKNKIEVVIHLAAYVSAAESEKLPQQYIENNIMGTQKVIEASVDAGVKKIIYASSAACLESASSIYAFSKYAPELLLYYYKNKIDTLSLRFFNIYGKGSNPVYGRAIDEFIKGIKEKEEVIIYGDGKQTRDFIHAKDVARSMKLAVEKKILSGSVIDIGTGKAISINKLAGIISNLMGKKPKIKYKPKRKEARFSEANMTKAKRFLSFKPEIDLEKGLKELLDSTGSL